MTRSDSNPDCAEIVLIPADFLADLRDMARSESRRECCGVLIGHGSPDGGQTVTAIRPAENEWPGAEQDRYLLSTASVRNAEESARRAGAVVLGFYHSHPADDVRPSPIDLAYAWPWYTYLIVAGAAPMHAAWRLREDRSGFVPQEVRVMASPGMRAIS